MDFIFPVSHAGGVGVTGVLESAKESYFRGAGEMKVMNRLAVALFAGVLLTGLAPAEHFRQVAAWFDQHVPGVAQASEIAEAVRAGQWELKVAGVRTPDAYAGVRPEGRYVEVELLIRAVQPTGERFSLLVFDTAGSEIFLVAPDRNLYPEGVVAESLGQRVLAKSSAQVLAFVPDADGHHPAVAVAFDSPPGTREFLLRVKEFPPIRIELPVETGGVR